MICVCRECIKLYFTANDIANAKKVPVFLSVIGAKNYKLLCNEPHCSGVCQGQDVRFLSKNSQGSLWTCPDIPVTERFHFHHRVQAPNMRRSEYVTQLRRLTIIIVKLYGGLIEESITTNFYGVYVETLAHRKRSHPRWSSTTCSGHGSCRT